MLMIARVRACLQYGSQMTQPVSVKHQEKQGRKNSWTVYGQMKKIHTFVRSSVVHPLFHRVIHNLEPVNCGLFAAVDIEVCHCTAFWLHRASFGRQTSEDGNGTRIAFSTAPTGDERIGAAFCLKSCPLTHRLIHNSAHPGAQCVLCWKDNVKTVPLPSVVHLSNNRNEQYRCSREFRREKVLISKRTGNFGVRQCVFYDLCLYIVISGEDLSSHYLCETCRYGQHE